MVTAFTSRRKGEIFPLRRLHISHSTMYSHYDEVSKLYAPGPDAARLLTARLSAHQVMINGRALSPPLFFMATVAAARSRAAVGVAFSSRTDSGRPGSSVACTPGCGLILCTILARAASIRRGTACGGARPMAAGQPWAWDGRGA